MITRTFPNATVPWLRFQVGYSKSRLGEWANPIRDTDGHWRNNVTSGYPAVETFRLTGYGETLEIAERMAKARTDYVPSYAQIVGCAPGYRSVIPIHRLTR
jgi:hypothetical protein